MRKILDCFINLYYLFGEKLEKKYPVLKVVVVVCRIGYFIKDLIFGDFGPLKTDRDRELIEEMKDAIRDAKNTYRKLRVTVDPKDREKLMEEYKLLKDMAVSLNKIRLSIKHQS